ncbi:MAG: hypothetical protein Kow0077_02400 [Anaerolineae bacterium]
MRFSHRFRVRAPLDRVADFHRRASALHAITPPLMFMRVHHAPAELQEGDVMDFSMWLGPIPVRWVARIEQVTEKSFVDRQVQGPFKAWAHTHSFIPVDDSVTEVRDEIEAELSDGVFGRLRSLVMWLGLPVLFAYRAWKTRRVLEAGRKR